MYIYRVWGKPNKDKSNAILYPTWYSGKHWDNDWLIGPGMGLDPNKYCIIVPNMFGNGLSSSPSNTPPPANAARFPEVMVLAQSYAFLACVPAYVHSVMHVCRGQLVLLLLTLQHSQQTHTFEAALRS